MYLILWEDVTFGKIKEHLIDTPILRKKVKFKAFNIKKQSDDECGLRMAKYITNICDQWESMNIAGFSNWLGRLLAKEIVDQRDLKHLETYSKEY
jgi:hypothetical protein